MAVRRLHRRLREAGRRLRERGYARLAALWRDGMGTDAGAEAERVFRGLAEWEAAEGAPLEAVLSRLPQGLAEAIRRELGAVLAAADAGLERPSAGP